MTITNMTVRKSVAKTRVYVQPVDWTVLADFVERATGVNKNAQVMRDRVKLYRQAMDYLALTFKIGNLAQRTDGVPTDTDDRRRLASDLMNRLDVVVSCLLAARWSGKAGCACGCSPGFVLDRAFGYDLHVTFDPQG